MQRLVYRPNDQAVDLPMSQLFRLSTLHRQMLTEEVKEPNVAWDSETRTTLCAFDVEVTAAQIGEMQRANIADLAGDMAWLIFGVREAGLLDQLPVPHDLTTITDQRSKVSSRYSFLADPENKGWVAACHNWMWGAIETDPIRRGQWMVDGMLEENQIRQHRASAHRALVKMAVVFWWGGGQPPRCPETTSLQFENTPFGGLRNIMVYQDSVIFLTIWTKSLWKTAGKTQRVWRRLPPQASRLVLIWIAVLQPWLEIVERKSRIIQTPPDERRHAFLTSYNTFGKPSFVQTSQVSEHLHQLTFTALGIGLGVQKMRHVLIAFAHRFFSKDDCSAMGIAQYFTHGPGIMTVEEAEEEQNANSLEELAGHSAHIGQRFYARETDSGAPFTRQLALGRSFHQLFGLSHLAVPGGLYAPSEATAASQDPSAQLLQARRIEDIARHLQDGELVNRAWGPGRTLHPIQRQLLEAIGQPDRKHILACAPTGTGKSVAFLLPALVENNGIIIVLQPTRELIGNTNQSLQRAGVDTLCWTDRIAGPSFRDRHPRVVLLTPESAERDDFQHWLARQHSHALVDMAVLDECHHVVFCPQDDEQKYYRPVFRRLGPLIRGISHKVVCLTATLPPSQEEVFRERMQFHDLHVIRHPTHHPHHRYLYIPLPKASTQGPMVDVVREFAAQLSPCARGLVFAPTIAIARELAGLLDCDALTSKETARNAILSRWEKTAGLLVATSTLAEGGNFANVELVLALQPRSIFQFVQMTGRIRGGGTSVLLSQSGAQLAPDVAGLAHAPCMRQALAVWADGATASGQAMRCGLSDQLCWRCQQHAVGMDSQIPLTIHCQLVTRGKQRVYKHVEFRS